MNAYQLVFSDDGFGKSKEIEFYAEDPSCALAMAKEIASTRSAVLWHNDKKLCTLSCWSDDFLVIR